MENILRLLAIWICKPIYNGILSLYEIFYALSTARFLQSSTVEKFSANIYVLVSVVMLFAFSATILSAIVNPDLISDKKKGVGAVFKRAIVGLVLMVIIPFAFNEAYKIQSSIMCSSAIEKIIVGLNIKTEPAGVDEDGLDRCSKNGGNGGQVITGTLMASVLYPKEKGISIYAYAGDDVGSSYKYMIEEDFREGVEDVADYINEPDVDGKYKHAFEFEGLIAIIAGLATAYILLLFAIDMAVRMFKLAFFELTAPVSVVAYIAAGGDTLKSWFSEVLKTYLDVFIRVAAMAFYLFLISNLNNFMNSNIGDGVRWSLLLKVLLIVGMLIFIKEVPNLINKVFKTNIKSTGGINGRLGEMAGIGKQAQKAWGAIKQAGKLAAGTFAAGAAIGAMATNPLGWGLMGSAWAGQHGWRKGFNKEHKGWKDMAVGKGLRTTGKALSTAGTVAGAYLGGKGITSGIKDAKKKFGETDFGKTYNANKENKKQNKFIEKLNKNMGDLVDKDGFIESKKGSAASNRLRQLLGSDALVPKTAKNEMLEYFNKKDITATHNQIKTNVSKINELFDTMMANTTDENVRQKLSNIKGNFNAGNFTAAQFEGQINGLVQSGIVTAANGTTLRNNFGNIVKTMEKAPEKITKEYDYTDGGLIKVQKNSDAVKRAETLEARAKGEYDKVYNTMSDDAKQSIDAYISKYDEAITQRVKDDKAYNVKDTADKDIYYDGDSFRVYNNSTQSSSQPQSGPQQSTSTQTVNQNIVNNNSTQNTNYSGSNTNAVNGSTFGVDQSAYEEALSEGFRPYTADFDQYMRSFSGYNGTGGQQQNNNASAVNGSTFGVDQSAYEEAISEGFRPYTADFDQYMRSFAGYNGTGGQQNNNASSNDNNLNNDINAQNVTINAANADVHAQTANINGGQFRFNNSNFNTSSTAASDDDDYDTSNDASNDNSDIIETLNEINDSIKSSSEDVSDAINDSTASVNRTMNKNEDTQHKDINNLNKNINNINDDNKE